jgi:RNA polymerase sigma-70 factor (ECF subfamily)
VLKKNHIAEDLSALSDEALMSYFRAQSDGNAIDTLARRYVKPATVIARRYLNEDLAHLAEDAVQETFVRVFRHTTRFDAGRSFSAWFYTILRNICADFRRFGARQNAMLQRYADSPSFKQHVTPRITIEHDVLNRIRPADREILIFRLVHGMTFEEIAKQTGVSLEAVKKRAQRALHRLRRVAKKEPRHVPFYSRQA